MNTDEELQASLREIRDLKIALDEHAIVAITDAQGRITHVNDKFCAISKYSREELLGQDHRIINSGHHSKEFMRDLWSTVGRGRTWHGEMKNRAKDGALYWVETMIVPFLNEHGKPRQYIAIRTDITERKIAEEALRVAHAQLRQLLERSPAVLYVLKLEGDKLVPHLISENVTTLLGFTVAEASHPDWWLGQLHPDDRERVVKSLTATPVAEASRLEYRLRHKEGHYCWVDDARKLVRDAAGEPVELIGVWTDITHRKWAEDIVQQASGQVVRSRRKQVIIDLAVLVTATVALYALARYTTWFSGVTRWFLAHDVEKMDEIILTAVFMAAGLATLAFRRWREAESDLTSRHQVQAALGLLHNELDQRVRQRTEELGGANRALRTEIAEHRRSETELQSSEARYHSLFDHAPDGIVIADAQSTYLDANTSMCRMLGYTRNELVGLHASDIVAPAEAQHIGAALSMIQANSTYHREWQFRRKDGSVFNAEVIATQMPDGNLLAMIRDITQRKQAEESLRLLNSAVLQSKESILITGAQLDAPGPQIVFVNPAFTRMTGYSAEDVVGQTPRILQGPRTDRRVLDRLRQNLAQGEVFAGEAINYRKDGTEFLLEWQVAPLRDAGEKITHFVAIQRDITERKRVEEALRASEKRFKALFEQAAVGVAQADAATGRFMQVNQRFCAILGRSREELEQLTFAEITHPQDVASSREGGRKIKEGTWREFTQEKRYLRKDHSEVWVNLTVSAMWAPGETPDYYIAVAQDITERKKLEEQFRQSQKMEAIGTLAGGIAHDFNNILAAINGYTELSQIVLKENPEVRGHLAAVLRASSRATDLIRQILTFSRQQPLQRRSIQPGPLVLESLALLRATLPATIEFDTALAADAPTVLADATQIHQIMMNLGTNAWHAMKDRPGRLQVKLERCVVEVAQAAPQTRLSPGVYARVSVSDSGSGMDQETLRRIFEPFFTTKPVGEGTGLGLAVVHGIMDSHDGTVTVESLPGEGTTFRLYFPEHTGQASAVVPTVVTVPRGRGERVLVVDDEELLARLGQKTLTALGYEAEFATQPAAALAMVRADPSRFALVLTDQTMPGMTGLMLATQLRQIRPGLPIILMTGYTAALTSEQFEAAGVGQLLLKPTTLHSLAAAVHAALSAQAG